MAFTTVPLEASRADRTDALHQPGPTRTTTPDKEIQTRMTPTHTSTP